MNEQGSASQPVLAPTTQELSFTGTAAAPALALLQQEAEQFVRAAKAPSTLRAYRSDWEHFQCWCHQHALCPLPASPETVALYLTALSATHRPATLTRRLTAITKAHQIAGEPSPATMQQPAVSETLKGFEERSVPRQ